MFLRAGTRPGRLTAVVAVTHLYEVKEADKVTRADARTVLLTAEVVIGDTPAPDHPDGGPAFPDGRYKLAAFVVSSALIGSRPGAGCSPPPGGAGGASTR